ncbi:hypothetical protein RyT2_27760 [Pseudolactococcus yaeyamensis]
MDPYYTLSRIQALATAITQFKHISSDLQNYRIQTLKKAGSGRWSGQKKNQYNDKLESAKSQLNRAKSSIEQSISECKSRQYSLVNTIDAVKHPDVVAQAWNVIRF